MGLTLKFVGETSENALTFNEFRTHCSTLLLVNGHQHEWPPPVTVQDLATISLVQSIRLTGENSTLEDIPTLHLAALGLMLTHSKGSIEEIRVSDKCYILCTEEDFAAFVIVMGTLRALRALWFSTVGFQVDVNSGRATRAWNQLVVGALKNSPHLRCLTVSHWFGTGGTTPCQMTPSDKLVAALLQAKNILILTLAIPECSGSKTMVHHILKGNSLPKLVHLQLTDFTLVTGGEIIEDLRGNKRLLALFLQPAETSLQGMKEFAIEAAGALRTDSVLERLSIHTGSASDTELETAFVDLLKQNTTLREIIFSSLSDKCRAPTGPIGMMLEWNKVGRKKLVANSHAMTRSEWVDALEWRKSSPDCVPWMFHVLQMNPSLCQLPAGSLLIERTGTVLRKRKRD